jgi:RHS repeat-associated protein
MTAKSACRKGAAPFGYDGSFYIRDDATVRRVSPGGKITRIGGLTTGSAITPVDGEVATKTPLDSQSLSRNLGVDAAGRVYVTSPVNSSGMSLGVFRIDLDGRIHRIAGGGSKGNNLADGLNATEADFGNFVHAMAVDAAGRVVLAHSPVPTTDSTGKSFSEPLRLIEPNGVIQTISPASPIDPARPLVTSELAYAAAISQPTALAWGPGGSISLLDSKGAVRQITTTGPGLSSGVALDQLAVVDPGGTEIYVFTTDGRHVKTVDALTGVLLWQFGYSGGSLSQITDRDNRVTLITRTDANVILTSPGGQQTKLSFDAAKGGWLSGVEYPGASLMPYPYTGGVKFVPEHDGQGLLLHFTDPRGKKSDFEYDPLTGRLTKDSDAAGGTQTLSIDPASSNTSWQVNIKTAENRVTNHAVAIDLHGTRVRKTTSWDGSVTTTTEPSDGSMTVSSPTGGLSATRGADPLFGTAVPLLKSVTAAPTAALTSTLTVDTTASAAGSSLLGGQNRTQTVTFGGGSWKIDYAKAGADQLTLTGPTLKNDPQVVIKAHHNDQGRIDKITLPWASKQITVGYHTSPPAIAGRVHTISQGSRVLTLGYDTASGFLTTIQDALLQTTTLTSDGLGRPRVVTAPGLTDTLKMTPNQNGALVSLSPPSKPAHSFDYDGKGRPTTYNPPPVASVPTTTETTGYSLDGFPLSLNLPGTSDNTIGLDYLDQKRLSRVNYPNNSSVTVTYDDTGTATRQLKSLTGPGSESLTFGWAGSLLTDITTQQGRKIVWTDFDAALRPQTEKLDGSPVATVYDNDGFPLTTTSSATLTGMVADGPSLTHSRAATPGLVASATFTVGSTTLGESFGYDPDFGEPSSYSISRSGQNLYKVEILQRDLLGRIVVRRETIGAGTGAEVVARRYEYDAAGRLTRERACTNPSDNTCAASTQAHSWSFDDNGNRLTSDSATSTYDAQDRLLPAPGVLEQTYTPDGRLQTKKVGTQTTTYTYDITGALVRVVPASGSTVDYKVDALGRRVERSAGGVVTRWVYGAGLGPVAEYSNGTLVARYVYARGRNVPDWAITAGGVYRFVTDERGSVRLVVRSDGAVVRRQDYDVWGVMTPPSPSDVNAPPQTFGFAGGMYDDTTKLVRFGARDYDPQLGRWTGKDSIRFDGGDTDLYSYSFNDPINYTDPYGTNPLVAVVISGGIGFAAGGIGSYLGQKASGGEIDGGDILIAALAGGANGALLPLFAEAGLASAVALGAASSALQYNATTVYHGRCPDALDMGGAALLGGALGFVSGAVAPYPTKMISGVRETKTLMADPLASRLNAKLGFEQVLGDSLFSGATTIGRAGIAGYWGNR